MRVSIIGIVFILSSCARQITSFSPTKGLPGTVVDIVGNGFAPNYYDNIVTIGNEPTRVISGSTTRLRVVALDEIVSGKIKVRVSPTLELVSTDSFHRDGTTTFATPMADSDAELVKGKGYDRNKHYDMAAQGLNQKILIVFARPSDINPEDLASPGSVAMNELIQKSANVNTFFQQASYNKTSVAFSSTPGWVTLSQNRDFYCWTQDDINRKQAVLDALQLDPSATQEQIDVATNELNNAKNSNNMLQEPDFLWAEALIGAKASVPDFDSYTDYLLIVAGPFLRGQCCWLETGYHAESTRLGLDFDIDFPALKGGTYVSQQADWGRIAHELSHFFAGGDIYSDSYADGSFLEGNAAQFCLMGNHDSHPLYIGSNFDKRLHYFNENVSSGNIHYLQWGSVPDLNQTFDIIAHGLIEDPAGNSVKHLIRLKVSDGLNYYIEVRQRPDAAAGPSSDYIFDPNITLDPTNPAWNGGVIIYKAVENNNQSNNNERPVMLLPPARMLQAGESFFDPARTIRITVESKIADRPAAYRIRVEWGHLPAADPNGQFDLRISPWNPPPWETVDIWVNSKKNDPTSPPKEVYQRHEPGDDTKPVGNGDNPWVGHDNFIYARITNQGAVQTPEDVKVSFYINTPPGVGDDGNWAPFHTENVGKLAPNETKIVKCSRAWRPSVGEHTCVKVYIESMTGEITFDNNSAQENFSDFETGASSPYQAVELDFIARNPYKTPVIMDIKARNVPKDWYVALQHGSVWLPPSGNKKIHAVIWTDRAQEWVSRNDSLAGPSKAMISIEGWCDRFGDQIFAVGGVTLVGHATRNVKIDSIQVSKENRRGQAVHISAFVMPSAGIVPVSIHITDPDGNTVVENTQSTANGVLTYLTTYKPDKPGKYKLQFFILQGSLASEYESQIISFRVL
ncbi:MAG: IPT/TIG domain-containing protein [Chitinophagaceae bacterium]